MTSKEKALRLMPDLHSDKSMSGRNGKWRIFHGKLLFAGPQRMESWAWKDAVERIQKERAEQ